MRPCVVGIGGAGSKILMQFLQNGDVNLKVYQFGEPSAFGNVSGVWLESAIQDTEDKDQTFYKNLVPGHYPGYLISHGLVDRDSNTNKYIRNTYGLDLKANGYDRRAEYLKSVFEILDFDPKLKDMCSNEFKGYEDPLFDYIWTAGIKKFVDTSIGKSIGTGMKSNAQKTGIIQNSWITKCMMPIRRRGNGVGRKHSKTCDSILFLASLGGGTGTGFINPITRYVRKENADFPIFAMGILTEKGSDDRNAPEGKRDLGATIAIQDLLTKEAGTGIDGLIPVDNQILAGKYKKNFPAMDSNIYDSLKPLLDARNYPGYHLQDDSQAIRGVFREVDKENDQEEVKKRLFPPILVPCYHIQPDHKGDINTLVEGALGKEGSLSALGNDGRLFPCDPTKADRAFVFTRGFFSEEEIAEAVASKTNLPYTMNEKKIEGKIKIYRKLGDSKNQDILILLRNPYGGTAGEHNCPGTLEWRLHDVISMAIEYIDENQTNILEFDYTQITKDKLKGYFYGKDGLRDELCNCLDRLEKGERQVFIKPLWIFKNGDINPNAPDRSPIRPEMPVGDEYALREMVKSELREILRSEDNKKKIKEILQS